MNDIKLFEDNQLSIIKTQINAIWEEFPEKAYVISNALEKLWKEQKAVFSDWFKSYVDNQWEVPGPYKVKTSTRVTYNFEDDEEWKAISEKLKEREELLKRATNASLKWEILCLESGEVVSPVGTKGTQIYTLTNK